MPKFPSSISLSCATSLRFSTSGRDAMPDPISGTTRPQPSCGSIAFFFVFKLLGCCVDSGRAIVALVPKFPVSAPLGFQRHSAIGSGSSGSAAAPGSSSALRASPTFACNPLRNGTHFKFPFCFSEPCWSKHLCSPGSFGHAYPNGGCV